MAASGFRGCPAVLAGVVLAALALPLSPGAHARPSSSSPIALAPDEALLWVVNPGADSVTIIDTATNQALTTVPVGDEPRSIAIDPRNRYALVANAAGNSVTVLRILDETPEDLEVVPDSRVGPAGELTTGAEAASVVISPDGRRAFVANAGQDTITVLDVRASGGPQILGNVDLRRSVCNGGDFKRHFQPRGLAVTADSTQLYTARFLSFTTKSGGVQGDDEGKVGVVCRLDIDTGSTDLADYQPAARIKLAPQVTGFQFPNFAEDTSAFPNQLQSIVIRGERAYLPNIAASPSAPLRFNVDTEAFVNVIGGVGAASQTDLGALNLHLGAQEPETGKKKLFFANPWAIAFTSQSGAGNAYVVSAASDLLVKLNVNAAGDLAFTGGAKTTRYIDLNDPDDPLTAGAKAGKNPRGIVISADGRRAYVANQVSRNVSVVDLTTDLVIAVVPTTPLPMPGSDAETVAVGAEVFFSSRGHFDRPAGATISTDERLSSDGWQACSSCHFEGLTDGVVWVFGTGPRKSVPLNASFNPADRDQQRILNYSAIFDEIEDFEINIRNVSGPGSLNGLNDPNHGLLFDDGVAPNPNIAPVVINAFTVPNAGRNEFAVTLPGAGRAPVPALTALRGWVRAAVRTPNGPLDDTEVDGGVKAANVARGRELFTEAGCQNCHGGSHWTTSRKDFDSPPDALEIAVETDPNGPDQRPNPVGAQYLDRFLEDVGSFNAGVAGGANPIGNDVGAAEFATAAPNAQGQLVLPDALGTDYDANGTGEGFNVPSLLGINALPPYLHNGACETVVCVLESRAHRTAGNATDVLDSQKKRNKVARFVQSIDLDTEPIEP